MNNTTQSEQSKRLNVFDILPILIIKKIHRATLKIVSGPTYGVRIFPLHVTRPRNQIQDDIIGRFIGAFILIRSVRDETKNARLGQASLLGAPATRNVITAYEFQLF